MTVPVFIRHGRVDAAGGFEDLGSFDHDMQLRRAVGKEYTVGVAVGPQGRDDQHRHAPRRTRPPRRDRCAIQTPNVSSAIAMTTGANTADTRSASR